MHLKPLSRRQFLQMSAGTSVLLLTTHAAPAAGSASTSVAEPAAESGQVHILKWANFVLLADNAMQIEVDAWGEANNVEVVLEIINRNDIRPRIDFAIQSGEGPDIIQHENNWAYFYSNSLVDVSELAEDISNDLGGYYEDQIAYSKVGDTWHTVPWTIVGNAHIYRIDWFEETLGRSEWGIDTWDDYIETAAAMKDAGYPFGHSRGLSTFEQPAFWYPWLWGHGGAEINEDGTNIVVNSAETIEAINQAIVLNDTGFIDGTASWDDGSNNRAYFAGEISSTLNIASIYFVALRDAVEIGDGVLLESVSNHGLHPAGPAGQFSLQQARSHGILNYSANVDSAKELLLHLTQPEFYEAWLIANQGYTIGVLNNYSDSKVWEQNEKMQPFNNAVVADTAKWPGWPAPPDERASAVLNEHIIVSMFNKAISGQMTAEEAAVWAAGEILRRYGRATYFPFVATNNK